MVNELPSTTTPGLDPTNKFAPFETYTAVYKIVEDHKIHVDLNVLKDRKPPSNEAGYPIILFLHGGSLITGRRHFAPWLPTWMLQFAEAQNAVVLDADYRFVPEAKGVEVWQDIKDLMVWVNEKFPAWVRSVAGEELKIDTSRIIVIGSSAGGLLSALVTLHLKHTCPGVRATISLYPVLDIGGGNWAVPHGPIKQPDGSMRLLKNYIADHMSRLPDGKVVSAAIPPARHDLDEAVLQEAAHVSLMGVPGEVEGAEDIYPLRVLKTLKSPDDVIPFVIMHGIEDVNVPIEGTDKFVALLEEVLPGTEYQVWRQHGEHGFDCSIELAESPWLLEGLEWVKEKWLG